MQDKLNEFSQNLGAEIKQKNDVFEIFKVIAERKAFLSKKKLTYTAKIKVNDEDKSVLFSEYLKESGSGLSSGGGYDNDMSPGFGFSKTSYKTGTDGISGSIKEQSNLFGKQYDYDYNYQEVRKNIEQLSKDNGYSFGYKIIPNF